MSSKPLLKLDWCSHAAAVYATTHWHYSRSMPTPPVVKIGVWETQRFIGCVLFSRGANKSLGSPYGLLTTELCELSRVALTLHATPVSRLIAIALKFLQRHCPELRLVVSFADMNQGHLGVIYQAGGWIYLGQSESRPKYQTTSGTILHGRQVSVIGVKPQYGRLRRVPKIADCQVIPQLGKHRYLYPLDEAMRAQIQPLAQPYPKRATSILADAPTAQAGESGAAPTVAL